MKISLCIAIFFGGIFFLSSGYAEMATSCPGESKELTFSFNSEFTLFSKFLPVEDSFLTESIQQHIQFLKTNLKSRMHKENVAIVFADEKPLVVSSQKQKTYSSWILNTQTPVATDFVPANEYVKKVIAAHDLSKTQPVTQIKYSAHVKALGCFNQVKKIDLTVKGPADPWMAHWLAPQKYIQDVRWEKSRFKIAPFFNSEYADIPEPKFCWYFWEPSYKGVNASGKKYDTTSALKGKTTLARVSIHSEKILNPLVEQLHHIPLADKPSLKATIVFGVTDPKMKQLEMVEVFRVHQSGRYQEWMAIEKKLLDWNSRNDIDPGASLATGFLTNMHNFLDMRTTFFSYSSEKNILVLNASLKMSGKPMRIHFFFGPTDLLATPEPTHWKVSHEGLVNDDIIFYIGHSGLGENFKSKNITDLSQLDLQKQIPTKDRLIGIFSCYSFSYFEKDMSQLLTPHSMLILTGSDYTSARGSVGVLQWLDESFTKAKPQKIAFMNPDDFLIFKNKMEEN